MRSIRLTRSWHGQISNLKANDEQSESVSTQQTLKAKGSAINCKAIRRLWLSNKFSTVRIVQDRKYFAMKSILLTTIVLSNCRITLVCSRAIHLHSLIYNRWTDRVGAGLAGLSVMPVRKRNIEQQRIMGRSDRYTIDFLSRTLSP